ncbi:MAG TPA: hypothetical protein VFO89_17095 [Thermoanaerobaculia bacterium]|nr:hypothetical protein [Thermoanaerobaculia bacterium]
MELIERLRNKVHRQSIDPAESELFQLLAAACSYCCTDARGGNETCPPPPKRVAE